MSGKNGGSKPPIPGRNKQILESALAAWNLPKVDTKDTQAVQERIEMYLKYCVDNDVAPSVTGCANWLHVTWSTLSLWYSGARATAEHHRIMVQFYGIVQDIWAQKMDGGDINPVSGIFMGKNFFGFKDSQEITVQNNSSQDQLSNSDLIAESKRLPGFDALALPEGTQTIDADFTVLDKPIEYDPGAIKAEERDRKKIEQRERSIRRIEKENAYQREWQRKYRERKKAEKEAAERAQKEANGTMGAQPPADDAT